MYRREAGGTSPFFFLLDTCPFGIPPHLSMYNAVEPLRYHTRIIAYIDSSSLFDDLFPSSCHTIPVLAHLFSADPRLIAFRTPLFHVDFRSSYLTLPPFRRGSCHVKTARFVLSCHSMGTSLPEIVLSAWMSASSLHPRRCKTSLVGQDAGLSIPRSSVRFRQKIKHRAIKSTWI